MAELYIFDQDDKLLTILSPETGLISAPVREELNQVPSEPFVFTVDAESEKAKYVVEQNQVVFRDYEGDLRLFRIVELDDSDSENGAETIATCEPAFMELKDHVVLDRRFSDKTADVALNAALTGTRWTGKVMADFGLASDNFYHISSVDAVWKVRNTWGGDLKDVVQFNDGNNIVAREIHLVQRLGSDKGQRFEIDHNIKEIGRTVVSYPKTALYGWGASLQTEGGGHTRYIDFADVEWSTAKGDPVDKPKGQRWVGDPDALLQYGLKHNGELIHLYGQYSNQDIEDQEDLLTLTWEALKTAQLPEVNYRLSVDLFDKKVALGDTAIAIDRYFARPIEIQARVIALEYDLVDPENTMVVEMGQFLNLNDDRLDKVINEVEKIRDRPNTVTEASYPDIKPSAPTNVSVEGGIEVVQIYWDYADEIYIKYYEVYGSQVKDFVPDQQHLLWRGQVSAFAHAVETDQVWYYRIRAVNYQGTASDWSVQVSGATRRVISDDILFGEDIANELKKLDIIADDAVTFEQLSENAKDALEQQAKQYTDKEIDFTKNQLMQDIADKADLSYVNGQLVDKADKDITDAIQSDVNDMRSDVNKNITDIASKADAKWVNGQLVSKANRDDVYTIADVDEKFDNTVSLTEYKTDKKGIITDLESHETRIRQTETDITAKVDNKQYQQDKHTLETSIKKNSAAIEINAEGIASKVDNTTYNTDKQGIITDINSNKSSIEQQADLIRSKVDATYVKGELGKIEVGGRNLLKSSNRNIENTSYRIARYDLTEEVKHGEAMTVVLKGKLGQDRSHWGIYNSGGYVSLITLRKEDETDDGLFVRSFKWDGKNSSYPPSNTYINVYQMYSSDKSASTIEWIKLVRGNKTSLDWTPAPEDTDRKIESVENYASEIEQTAKGIEQNVSAIKTDYETFKSTANSTFKQQADLIEGKVSETIYNKDKNGIITDLQQHDSRISQNANKIESKVDSTYVVNAIDGIEVGGRNLASKSSLKGWSGGYREENGVFTLEAEKSQSAGIAIDDSVFVEGQHYVLSFKIRKLSGSITYMGGHAESFPTRKIIVNGKEQGTNWNSASTPYPNDEGIYKFEVYLQHKKRSGANHNLYIQPNRSHYGLPYVAEIWDLKVEKGNKATDWTPAPEDIDADLANLEKGVVNLDSEIKQVAGQIKLKASKELVDDLTGRMSQAESSINVLSNEIDLKVNEDNIVSQINLKKEGIRLKGNLIELDGTTLIRSGIIKTAHIENGAITNAKLGRAVVDTAQIADLAVTDAKIASLNADKISAASLSAITANLGTVRAGRLLSSNSNMDLNLNTGDLTMRNADFTIGNGASINFEDAGNTITYRKYDSSVGFSRSSGLGVGLVKGGLYPFAYLGTTGASDLDTLSKWYSGFMAMPTAYIADGAANSVTGYRFEMRNTAVNWDKGLEFDFNGAPTIRPINGHKTNYYIGEDSYRFHCIYVDQVRGKQAFNIQNYYNKRSGWYIETSYAGNGTDITIRGMYGSDYNYQIGGNSVSNAIRNIYLRNVPQYPSDERLKEDIVNNELGLNFINDVQTLAYRLKQKPSEKERNQIQFGIVAQQLKSAFEKHGVNLGEYSIINIDDDGMYGVQESQLLFPAIKAIQEVDKKLDNEVNWLKIENQHLRNKVTKLEYRVNQLEEMIA